MGLTPSLVTGVWVGAEDRFAHFESTATGQGANTALPVWAYYMQGVYKEGGKFGVTASDKFEKPKDIEKRWDCSNTYGFHQYDEIYDPGPIIEGSGGESVGENYEVPDPEEGQ